MARCDDVEKTLRIVVTSGLVNRSRFTQGIRDSLTQPLQKARRGALHVVQGRAKTRACLSQHAHAQHVVCLTPLLCNSLLCKSLLCNVSWEPLQVTRAMHAPLHGCLIDVSSPAALSAQLDPARSARSCRSDAIGCLLGETGLHDKNHKNP